MENTLKKSIILNTIEEKLKDYRDILEMYNVGQVLQTADGVARVFDLPFVCAGEKLRFSDGTYGIALNLEKQNIGVVLMSTGTNIKEGTLVSSTGKVTKIPVGEAFLGRVVDALAQPLDGKGNIINIKIRRVESMAPGIIDRKSVCEPIQTGIMAIDSMIPIGRGQRELIIGDRQTGKTQLRFIQS